jgi:signal peptidase I
MSPLLKSGSFLLVKKNKNKVRCKITEQDIVVVKFYNKYLVKKVFGVSSTNLVLSGDSLTNNGETIIISNTWKHKYVDPISNNFILPPDSFLIIGLNKTKSLDSRKVGPFHCYELIGTYILHIN